MNEGQLGITEELHVALVECDTITVSRSAVRELLARLELGDMTALDDLRKLVK